MCESIIVMATGAHARVCEGISDGNEGRAPMRGNGSNSFRCQTTFVSCSVSVERCMQAVQVCRNHLCGESSYS